MACRVVRGQDDGVDTFEMKSSTWLCWRRVIAAGIDDHQGNSHISRPRRACRIPCPDRTAPRDSGWRRRSSCERPRGARGRRSVRLLCADESKQRGGGGRQPAEAIRASALFKVNFSLRYRRYRRPMNVPAWALFYLLSTACDVSLVQSVEKDVATPVAARLNGLVEPGIGERTRTNYRSRPLRVTFQPERPRALPGIRNHDIGLRHVSAA